MSLATAAGADRAMIDRVDPATDGRVGRDAGGRLVDRPRRLLVVIGNPVAGSAGRSIVRSAVALLRRYARRVEVGLTHARGDAETLCREAVRAGADMVVAAGGDGTINEVVNGLAGSGVALGVIPLGTANVLALEAGLPLDPEAACRLLLHGRPRPVHVGLAGDRRFLLMAGAGFDAAVIYRTPRALKEHLGKSAYIATGVGTLLAPGRRPRLQVEAEGHAPVAATGVIIGNGHLYGGTYSVTPGARLGDPWLEVCVFRGGRAVDWMRYAWGVLRGTHASYRDVSILRTRRLVVTSTGRVHVHADGDLIGRLPMEFSVAGETLDLILPPRGAGA